MNQNLVVFINSLILISLIVGIPFLGICIISLFKFKFNKTFKIFLYSFATGLLIILGAVGFIGESISLLHESFNTIGIYNQPAEIGISIGVVVGGAIIGSALIFLVRYLTFKIKSKKHNHTFNHDHNEHITNYGDIDCKVENKKNALILLTGHRLIDGLSLGFLAYRVTDIGQFESWGMIIVFCIHIVPTTLVVYLTQYDIYKTKKKAFLYSFYSILIFIPFVIIGAYLSEYIQTVFWLMPFLFCISGSIMVIISIIELIPEFIHNKTMKTKYWYLTILTLVIGILLALLLICIHTH